ncbi:MAG: hypothetical protein EOP22_15435 [Hyphomicrobiales bacterium]|nr:MAG: hypothetical protein EOP22_15435 [Hyphomicrobiales bacterium]
MNPVGYNIFVLVFCGAATAVLAWSLVDGLKTGKIALRYGGWATRAKQPVGFWFTVCVMSGLLALCCLGLVATVFDLLGWREQLAATLSVYEVITPGLALIGLVAPAALTAYCAWLLVGGLRTGRIGYRDGWAVRATQPLGYWLVLAGLAALVAGFSYVLLRLLFG